MPQTITLNDFSAGWCPSDDEFNGRKNALLHMDNVSLDLNGALVLAAGCFVTASGFLGDGHTLYSRVMNGVRHDYVMDSSGRIYRDGVAIAGIGDFTNGAFGTAFNFTLAVLGPVRIKDTGVGIPPLTLGIGPPTVAITLASQAFKVTPNVLLLANTVDVVGTSAVVGATREFTLSTESDGTGAGVVQSFAMAGAPVNWNLFDDGSGPTNGDLLYIRLQNFDPINDIFRIDFLLEAGNASGDSVANIFSFFPPSDRFIFNNPILADFVTLALRRDDFQRLGSGIQSWGTVHGFRIVITSPEGGKVVIVTGGSTDNYFYFIGGANTQQGYYEYAQMNVNNTGSYLAKSVLGPTSLPIYANNVISTLTYQAATAIDPQVNEVWIFRRSLNGQGLLDQWYRVGIASAAGTVFVDTTSDIDAITENITVNLNLRSIAYPSIVDKIFDIVGPIEGRWLYFTTNFMYPSDINNPDLVDVSIAVRICGSASELFMWARAIGDSTILVGTTVDIYLLTGTFSTLPDNTVDIYYRPLGVKFPPICRDAAVYSSTVYYLGSDGWRSISMGGGNQLLVAPNTDRLYNNYAVLTRAGTAFGPVPLRAFPVGTGRFPVCVSNNKLYCFIPSVNRIEVFDFVRKYWRTVNFGLGGVTAVFATQDGWVMAFFNSDRKVRLLETSGHLTDNVTKPTITIVTPVVDNGTPKQRKDSYTLKLRGYTGGSGGSLAVKIVKDDNTVITLGAPWATGGVNVVDTPFDISSQVGISKNFQIAIVGPSADFKLTDISIEVDTRPVQLSFLRIQSLNYGTSARKRVFGIPFQIDTLGNNVLFTQWADNVAQPGLTVNSNYKESFTYESVATANDVTKARDFEYTLSAASGLFEYFGGEGAPRGIEIFPEPCKAFVIPVTNFGSATKKRVRVWPFVLDPLGGVVTFTPLVDNVVTPGTAFSHTGKKTVFHFFKTDVFGVDYSGCFSSPTEFELWQVLAPDIVQALPIARQYDQVGPAELFKYGRVKQIEIRILPRGGLVGTQSNLPFLIFFNDNANFAGNVTVDNEIEASYYIGTPKGTSGQIVRIEMGPTGYDFHRYYIRAQVAKSGRDTELEWITLALEG